MDHCSPHVSHNLSGDLNCVPFTLNMFRMIRLSQGSVGPGGITETLCYAHGGGTNSRESALIRKPSFCQSPRASAGRSSPNSPWRSPSLPDSVLPSRCAPLSARVQVPAGQGTRRPAEMMRTVTRPRRETHPTSSGLRCWSMLPRPLVLIPVTSRVTPHQSFRVFLTKQSQLPSA